VRDFPLPSSFSNFSLVVCTMLELTRSPNSHSFKLLPNIGKHVVELLEGTLADDLKQAWRWRPGQGDALKSRRAAPAKDLADMPGWKHDEKAKL
jgi:sarcosine oxidase/L-pipecolate oxidase